MTIERIDHTSHEVVRQLLSLTSNHSGAGGANEFSSLLSSQSTASEHADSLAPPKVASDARVDVTDDEREDERDDEHARFIELAESQREASDVKRDARSRTAREETGSSLGSERVVDDGSAIGRRSSSELDQGVGVGTGERRIGEPLERHPSSSDEHASGEHANGEHDNDPETRPRILPIDGPGKKHHEGRYDELGNASQSKDGGEHSQLFGEADDQQTEAAVPHSSLSSHNLADQSASLREPNDVDEVGSSLSRSIPPGDQRSRFQQRIDELEGQTIPGRESTLPVTPGEEFDPTKPLPSQARPGVGHADQKVKAREKFAKSIATSGGKGTGEFKDNIASVDGASRDSVLTQAPTSIDASRPSTGSDTSAIGTLDGSSNGLGQPGQGIAGTHPNNTDARASIAPIPSIGGPTNQGSTERSTTGSESIQQAQVRLNRAQHRRLMQRVTRAFRVAQNRGGEIRIRLSPPELGAMKLKMRITDNSMVAKITTETEAARVTLIDSLPQLRERLAEHGFEIEQFEVEQGDDFDQTESSDQRENRSDEQAHSDAQGNASARSDSNRTDDERTAATDLEADPQSWPDNTEAGINVVV